ncbi:MAG: DUF4255 domain-containing protein [Symploca sp. SIO2D2]|nr:DUF4255 domain-containing protein [Symploca sp. SIO2D2]
MLEDLDDTLKFLLKKELPKRWKRKVTFSFDLPVEVKIDATDLAAINLFLYDVRDNLELRTSAYSVARQYQSVPNNQVRVTKLPPKFVDISYLITTFAHDEANNIGEKVEQEHSLLGEVMKVLLLFPQIPEEYLKGSLQGYDLPVYTAFMHQNGTKTLGEYWQAMGGKPKAVLNLTVTMPVPMNLEEEEEELPIIKEKPVIVGGLLPYYNDRRIVIEEKNDSGKEEKEEATGKE